ncbi:hypothetical protein FRACA_2260009 [Frankia canadensis]|uniref:Uncharacterized protein n=1 Tax=Frankia canadensis TaxID=1836972 RepID=A0A2I2KR97_9ACTN|nr:hypothetical protein FRACA_2260009 [Frankia canadensis]SOU55472.1 hypothetical protein FRACA_2260009 [Frankia canadensis]
MNRPGTETRTRGGSPVSVRGRAAAVEISAPRRDPRGHQLAGKQLVRAGAHLRFWGHSPQPLWSWDRYESAVRGSVDRFWLRVRMASATVCPAGESFSVSTPGSRGVESALL